MELIKYQLKGKYMHLVVKQYNAASALLVLFQKLEQRKQSQMKHF